MMVSLECCLGDGNVSKTLTGMVKWLRKAEAEGVSDVRALVPSWISSCGMICAAVLQIARSHDLSAAAEQLRTRRDDASAEACSGGGSLVSIGSLRLLVVSISLVLRQMTGLPVVALMIMVLLFVRLLRLLSFALKIFSCDWRKWIPS